MRTNGRFLIGVCVAAIVFWLAWNLREAFSSGRPVPSEQEGNGTVAAESKGRTSVEGDAGETSTASAEESETDDGEAAGLDPARLSAGATVLRQLDERMTEAEKNRPECLDLARKLLRMPGADRFQSEAIQALQWLGGEEVLDDFLYAMKEGSNTVNEEGQAGLLQVLQELDDEDLKKQYIPKAVMLASSTESRNVLLMALSDMDAEVSVPVLVSLLKSRREEDVEQAKEYLERITEDDSIDTPEAAMKWLETHPKKPAVQGDTDPDAETLLEQ